jgi:hypothetical protein
MVFSFKRFMEEKGGENKPVNYIDASEKELGATVPQEFSTGYLDLPDKGLYFNQSIWQTLPFEPHDKYVRIKYFGTNNTNPNFVRAYIKSKDGKMQPYLGKLEDSVHMISKEKLGAILGLPFQATAAAAAAGGGMGGIT